QGRFEEALTLAASIPAEEFAGQAGMVGKVLAELSADERPLLIPAPVATLAPSTSGLRAELPGAERWSAAQTAAIAAEGVRLARDGEAELGIAYLRRAVEMSPDDLDIRRDYAVVLTWN